jgi:hypothetical protein
VRSKTLDTLRPLEAALFTQGDNESAARDLGIVLADRPVGFLPDVEVIRVVWSSEEAVERRRRLRHAALRSLGRDPVAEEAAAAAERDRYAALAARAAVSGGVGSNVITSSSVRRAAGDAERAGVLSCCSVM